MTIQSRGVRDLDDAIDKLGKTGLRIKSQRDELAQVICAGFDYDPGHSDLDDEQPIHVRMTLGDYRKARRVQS